MAKMWRIFSILYDFYLMQLIFVSVWFYWWAKHIPCLCLPCLWHSRSFWGWALHPVELSALPMEQAQAAMTWRREQSKYLPRAGQPGDLEYVERRCIPVIWMSDSELSIPGLPLTQLSRGTPTELSPSVPWKWLSIHLHTAKTQEGFTLDSEVKAVGHF